MRVLSSVIVFLIIMIHELAQVVESFFGFDQSLERLIYLSIADLDGTKCVTSHICKEDHSKCRVSVLIGEILGRTITS